MFPDKMGMFTSYYLISSLSQLLSFFMDCWPDLWNKDKHFAEERNRKVGKHIEDVVSYNITIQIYENIQVRKPQAQTKYCGKKTKAFTSLVSLKLSKWTFLVRIAKLLQPKPWFHLPHTEQLITKQPLLCHYKSPSLCTEEVCLLDQRLVSGTR